MTTNILKQVRGTVRAMQPYQPGKPVEEAQRELGIAEFVKLASNENPRGPGPGVMQALAAALPDLNRYPDANGFYLKQVLAERHAVAPECLTLGCGSNDILELVASGWLDHSTEAVFSQYAFLVYVLATARSGAAACVVDAIDYGHDAAAMAAAVNARTRVIYIANPNNPTGTYISDAALRGLLSAVPDTVLVVVDEAYYEYVDAPDYPDTGALLAAHPNLLVARTFSKAFGLSGLRIGYSISHPDVADVLNRVRQPFNVSSLALEAARAALSDQAWLDESVALNRAGMQQLREGFQQQGIDYIDSVANFMTFKAPVDAAALNDALLQLGVIVRPLANYAMPGHLRVSIGLEHENAQFLAALAQACDAGV